WRLRTAGSSRGLRGAGRGNRPAACRPRPRLPAWQCRATAGEGAFQPRGDGATLRGLLREPGATPGRLTPGFVAVRRTARLGGPRLNGRWFWMTPYNRSPWEATAMRSRLYYWRRCLWDFVRYSAFCGSQMSKLLARLAHLRRKPLDRLSMLCRAARLYPTRRRQLWLRPALESERAQLDIPATG